MIRANKPAAGGAVSTPVEIAPVAGTPVARPPLAVEPSGTLFAARPGASVHAPSPLLDPFDLPTNPASAVTAGVQVGQWNRAGASLFTASDVDAALSRGAIEENVPLALQPLARQLARALGRDGPLGSHGPLGKLGPVADEPWSPSFWMKEAGDWSERSTKLAELGGPGSDLGPLGSHGPIARRNDGLDAAVLAELGGGGMFAPLGPYGPLGALGALGYLGLVGGHGYARNDDGHFVKPGGEIVKTATVLGPNAETKTFELVELYPEKVAKAARIHDASWIIKGAITKDEVDGDAFRFTAKKGQIVTLAVVPESAGDVMTVELVRNGKVIGRSDSDALANWIHFQVDRSGPLEVRVNKKSLAPARLPSASNLYIDWVLSPLVAWGEAVRPWVGAKPRDEGAGYRLYSVSTPAG